MKRLLSLAICLFYFFTASAQTEKGRFAISGNTNMSMMFGKTTLMMDSTLGQKQNSRSFNANLGFAWFAANNLAIGVSASYQYQRVDADNSIGYLQNHTAGILPAITYFIPAKGNLKPTITAGAGYLWYFTSEIDAEGLSLNVAPGISYFVTRNISLDLGVQYSYNDLKNTSGFDVNYKQQAIALLAGVSIYF